MIQPGGFERLSRHELSIAGGSKRHRSILSARSGHCRADGGIGDRLEGMVPRLEFHGHRVARFDLGSDVLFLVANRKDLSAEESPLFDFIVRDLDKAGIDPLAASTP